MPPLTRLATPIETACDASFVAGLDIGGTKIAACLASPSGIVARRRAPVPLSGDPGAIAECGLELLAQCCGEAGVSLDRLERVGVSSCGPFTNGSGGLALVSPNLCGGLAGGGALPNAWHSVPIEAGLRRRLPNLTIANDACAALLAEHQFGVLAGVEHCAYLTWSTGVGFGLMLAGQALLGKSGNAGHLGHAVPARTGADAPVCGCGNAGDLESVCGGAALGRRWGGSTESLFAAFRAGDPRAMALIDDALDALSAALYNLVLTLDLERIAVGGSLFCAHADLLLPALSARTFHHPSRRGMGTLLQGVSLVGVDDPARTAELGALCLVLPDAWAARWTRAGVSLS